MLHFCLLNYKTLVTTFYSKKFAFQLIESRPNWDFLGLDALEVLDRGYHETIEICMKCGKQRTLYSVTNFMHPLTFDVGQLSFKRENQSVRALAKIKGLIREG